uniref:SFRICE_006233 n=1 Tax=Spodoptera frugiperda TaxID=7108 RepID=A0A2H1WW59_SPOFR
MTRPYLFGIAVLLALSCLEVSSKPSNSELAKTNKELTNEAAEKERSLAYDETNTENEDVTKDILEKIKAINDALKKPIRRHQFQWNAPPQPGGEYVLDKEVLEKLQQVIASGKLNHHSNHAQQDSNRISNDDLDDTRYSRQLTSLYGGNPAQMAVMPGAYIMNMPVLVMPSMNTMYGNSINPTEYATKIQTKEGPSPSPSPFPSFPSLPPFQWPFAPLFPILIRDPLLSIMNGGGWNNFIEYGQNADVCRRQKSNEATIEDVVKTKDDLDKSSEIITNTITNLRSRQKRAVKKRTVAQGSQLQDIDSAKLNKFFGVKPSSTTAKPSKREPVSQDTKTVHHDDGDVRFGFLDLFGNKNGYRQPTGPGFFINRLKVRRGGVAIAGPGGVATAGRGGTAIVGPGGLAYTQPGGLAVAGPAARIVALSPDADLTAIAHRLQAQSKIDGSISQLLQAIPEGKIVATGPIIYYHPNER